MIPILLYHSIDSDSDPRFSEWQVPPERFGAQLDHLVDRGYKTMTISDLVDRAWRTDTPLDPKTIAITFDDGFEDVYRNAWPELQRTGLTATVYVTTAHIGGTSRWLERQGEAARPMMDAAQIAEISDGGIEIGAHGHTHAQLDRLPRSAVTREIETCQTTLEEIVGPVRSFAYPHGYYSGAVKRAVQSAGFDSACAVRDASSNRDEDRFSISRMIVRDRTLRADFARLIEGQAPRSRVDRPLLRTAWRAARRVGADRLLEGPLTRRSTQGLG